MLKISTLLFVIYMGTIITNAQIVFPIQEQITPLKSTRKNVHKIGTLVSENNNEENYETKYGRISVKYSKTVCDSSGWNIPVDTVISYMYYPRQEMTVEAAQKVGGVTVRMSDGDDINVQIFINKAAGWEYVTNMNSPYVTAWRFFPSSKQTNQRCKGFPDYDPVSEKYKPYEKVRVQDASIWDPAEIFGTLAKAKFEKMKVYLFVYCSKNRLSECNEVMRRIMLAVSHEFPEGTKNVLVTIGGRRANTEVEGFATFIDSPSVIARPYCPSM